MVPGRSRARCLTSMRNLQPLIATVLALGVGACHETTATPDTPNGSWSPSSIWSGQVVIAENTDSSRWPSNPVTITSATVTGDSLELAVTYGGGCRAHAFLLLSDSAWMESYPVQVGVRLAHDNEGDNCKALLSRILRFDLTPLKTAYNAAYHTTSGVIRLNIRGGGSALYSW